MKLWQLRKLSTNENLSEPQPLPENWGPIHGMLGFKDQLGDLSWLNNSEVADQGWFETDIEDTGVVTSKVSTEETIIATARQLLADSDWAMMPDIPMTNGDKTKWEVYRKELREIKLQPGFPDQVTWPHKP